MAIRIDGHSILRQKENLKHKCLGLKLCCM